MCNEKRFGGDMAVKERQAEGLAGPFVAVHARIIRAWVPLALCVVAFGLYVAGFNTSRRDTTLDGGLLYFARIVQIGAFLACAWFFRDHIPSVRHLSIAALTALFVHLALSALAVSGLVASSLAGLVSNGLSGVANALFVLIFAHFFSTYHPAASSVAIVCAFLLRELLFSWTALLGTGAVVAAQAWMRVAAIVLLFLAMRLKGEDGPTLEEHPLQYGMATVDAADMRPLRYLVNGADWVFQIIVAALTPFIFGFMSQLFSTGSLSDGLHDLVSEAGAMVSLFVLLAVACKRGKSLSFIDLLVPTVLLNALGLALAPVLWEVAPQAAGVLLKCAVAVNEPLLWILLAHKAFEDPRHTYLYFGAFLSIWNVTYGRLVAPLVLGGAPVSAALLSNVCMAFLVAIILVCLLLFSLQYEGLVPIERHAARFAGSGVRGSSLPGAAASGEEALGDVGPGAGAAFTRGVKELCGECRLTPREVEILTKALHGYSMPNIAEQLGISPETVRTHMRNIYQKAGVTNKQELIRLVEAR